MATGSDAAQARMISVERVSVYSDAVIGILMTLLVVESISQLDVLRIASYASTPSPDHIVLRWLDAQKWQFLAHAVGFFMIAYLWRRHHEIFRNFADLDRGVLWVNVGFLLSVSAIPYTAFLLSRSHFNPLAIAMFALVSIVAMAFLFWLLHIGVRSKVFRFRTPAVLRILHLYVLGPMLIAAISMAFALIAAATGSVILVLVSVCCPLLAIAIPIRARQLLIREPATLPAGFLPGGVDAADLVVEQPGTRGPLAKFFAGISPHRTLVFTDGVYAIALTAMALQIAPDRPYLPDNASVLASIKETFDPNLTYGNFWFYALLFVLMQMIWLQHQRLFIIVQQVPDRTIWLNTVHLFTIVMLPVAFGVVSAALYTAVIPWWIATITLLCAEATILPIAWSNLRYKTIRTELSDRIWRITVSESLYLCLLVLIMLAPLGLFRVALPLLLLKDPFVNMLWRQSDSAPRRKVRRVLFDVPLKSIGSTLSWSGLSIVAFAIILAIAISYVGNGIELLTLN